MKNLCAALIFLCSTLCAQIVIAENHTQLPEPVIIIPEDDMTDAVDADPVIIFDENPVPIITFDEPVILPLPDPMPQVTITVNTGDAGPVDDWEAYDRGYREGYDAGLAVQDIPNPDTVAVMESDDGTQVVIEDVSDPQTPDTVNIDINVTDNAAADATTPLQDPIFLPDPDASNDAALGISSDFRKALNDHTLAVLDWQLKTSERVLLLIMFMSTAGIFFAGYQLWRSFDGLEKRATLPDGATAAAPHPEQATSTVSFDKGKFEVSSPVVGILVLVISLAALYMFLNFVYQIDVVPVGAAAQVTEAFE